MAEMKYNGRQATKWTLVNATAAVQIEKPEQHKKKYKKIKKMRKNKNW